MAAIITRRPSSLTIMERPMSLFDELTHEWFSPSPTARLDMFEENDELVIKTELPGVSKDSIDITLDGDMLNIRVEKKEDKVSEDATYYTCERTFGQISRSVSLPYPVDFDKASSKFENGVLEIRLPKSEEAKAKRIEVK